VCASPSNETADAAHSCVVAAVAGETESFDKRWMHVRAEAFVRASALSVAADVGDPAAFVVLRHAVVCVGAVVCFVGVAVVIRSRPTCGELGSKQTFVSLDTLGLVEVHLTDSESVSAARSASVNQGASRQASVLAGGAAQAGKASAQQIAIEKSFGEWLRATQSRRHVSVGASSVSRLPTSVTRFSGSSRLGAQERAMGAID